MNKPMRKLLLMCLCGIAATACIDRDYDLTTLDTDNLAIGSDDSEFEIPLATVQIFTENILNGDTDIETLLRKADIWLPSELAEGYVDLRKTDDTEYVGQLFDDLIAEMQQNAAKRDAVADLVWEDHKNAFAPLLGVGGATAADEAAFKEAFRTSYGSDPQVQAQIRTQLGSYLSSELTIDPLRYELGHVDISEDVINMLADNLDLAGTPNAKNTLHLAGSVRNQLPVSAVLNPMFTIQGNRLFDFEVTLDAVQEQTRIPETQIFAEEFRNLMDDAQLYIPVALTRYYPGRGFAPAPGETQIEIRLYLVKRGSLKLDI